MRFLALLVGLVAAFGGSYGAFAAVRAVGPENRTNEFGFGDAATVSPNGGDLLESRNFRLVIAALQREAGADGLITNLSVERAEASASVKVGDRMRTVEIDASGRSRTRGDDAASKTVWMPVSRLDPAAIDAMVGEAQKQARAIVETLRLTTTTREWTVDMDGGEPDSFIANLDGGGLRLSGEPNPVGPGAAPDSLLREENLVKVIAAAREEAPAGARLLHFDIRPDRVSFDLETGGRQLSLGYGYDAQSTGRTLSAKTGADVPTIEWDDVDASAPERMARTAKKLLRRDLADVNYVLLSQSFLTGDKPALSMYFRDSSDPGYVIANLHGRHLTWPGRGD
jgi:hypothetical protein